MHLQVEADAEVKGQLQNFLDSVSRSGSDVCGKETEVPPHPRVRHTPCLGRRKNWWGWGSRFASSAQGPGMNGQEKQAHPKREPRLAAPYYPPPQAQPYPGAPPTLGPVELALQWQWARPPAPSVH